MLNVSSPLPPESGEASRSRSAMTCSCSCFPALVTGFTRPLVVMAVISDALLCSLLNGQEDQRWWSRFALIDARDADEEESWNAESPAAAASALEVDVALLLLAKLALLLSPSEEGCGEDVVEVVVDEGWSGLCVWMALLVVGVWSRWSRNECDSLVLLTFSNLSPSLFAPSCNPNSAPIEGWN